MEATFLEYGVLGAGFIALGGFTVKLISGILEENKKDKERHYTDMKELQEAHRQQIKEMQEMYKNESLESRQVYIDSINKVVGELDVVKEDIKEIKEKIL